MGSATKARLWALRYGLAPDVRVAVFPLPEATAEDTGAAHVTVLLAPRLLRLHVVRDELITL